MLLNAVLILYIIPMINYKSTKRHQIELIAKTYTNLLNSIDWTDELLIAGLREGLNKFLSNAFLYTSEKRKYHQGDFYSENALRKIKVNDLNNLVYEHIVPKTKYIQNPCEDMARKGTLTSEFVLDLVDKYFKIAIITKEEEKKLSRTKMPIKWDGINIFARYDEIGLKLISPEF